MGVPRLRDSGAPLPCPPLSPLSRCPQALPDEDVGQLTGRGRPSSPFRSLAPRMKDAHTLRRPVGRRASAHSSVGAASPRGAPAHAPWPEALPKCGAGRRARQGTLIVALSYVSLWGATARRRLSLAPAGAACGPFALQRRVWPGAGGRPSWHKQIGAKSAAGSAAGRRRRRPPSPGCASPSPRSIDGPSPTRSGRTHSGHSLTLSGSLSLSLSLCLAPLSGCSLSLLCMGSMSAMIRAWRVRHHDCSRAGRAAPTRCPPLGLPVLGRRPGSASGRPRRARAPAPPRHEKEERGRPRQAGCTIARSDRGASSCGSGARWGVNAWNLWAGKERRAGTCAPCGSCETRDACGRLGQRGVEGAPADRAGRLPCSW